MTPKSNQFLRLKKAPVAKRVGRYIVDADGLVFSTHKRKRLRGSTNSKGYLQLPNKELYHRVVAQAWVKGRTDARKDINHIDGNKLNNHPSNLEWCTASENNAHARNIGLR